MKKLLMSAGAVLLVGCAGGCGGDSGRAVIAPTGNPADMSGYETSHPLADNSNSSVYKVLLMGNSHAAGLRPILDRLLILGQPDKSVDVQLAPRALLTALVFYQIITGQPVESLPELSEFDIDSATEQIMKESVSYLLFAYTFCAYES